jgi:hypothetical protein
VRDISSARGTPNKPGERTYAQFNFARLPVHPRSPSRRRRRVGDSRWKNAVPVVDGIPNCVYPPRLGTDVKERTLRSLIRLQDGRYLVCRESLPLPWPGRARSVRRVVLVPAAKAA